MNNYKIFIIFSFTFFFTSCLSLMEETGQILDGSAFLEKTITVFKSDSQDEIEITVAENKGKEKSVIISIKKYPMLKLRGSFPESNGFFQFTSLEYLAGSTFGWNEFSLQILGTGRLYLNDLENQQLTSLEIIEEIEFAGITSARIHRYDTRITGEQALASLRGRYDRITAFVEWMLSLDYGIKNQSVNEFEKHWKPFLFPEMVNKKNKPYNWRHESDVFLRAEDINWNTGYTERLFLQELYDIRNSGTLLRDWEEALNWIYMFYEWDNIVNILSSKIILIRARS